MSLGTRGCLGSAGGRNIRLVCYVGSVQAVLASRTLLFADNRRAARSGCLLVKQFGGLAEELVDGVTVAVRFLV